MSENLVAVFSLGLYTHVSVGFFGVKSSLPVMRTLIFTDKRLIVATVATSNDVDPSIKRHTAEYQTALRRCAGDKTATLARGGNLESLLRNPNNLSFEYGGVRKISKHTLLLPKLEVDLNDRTVLRFTSIDKEEFGTSFATLKQAMPDKIQ